MNRGTRLRWATVRAGLLAVVLLAGVLAQLAPAVVTAPVARAHASAANGSSATGAAQGAAVGTPAPAPAPVPTPTSGDPAVPLPLPGPVTSPAPATPIVDPTTAIGRPHPVSMPQGAVALIPGQAAHFSGSDGAFSVDVPADAVTAADVAAGGGALSLLITQLAGPSGSIAGGSGQVTYGTYVAQVVDATGAVAATGLRDAPTFTLHLAGKFGPLDLSQVTVVFNGPLPVWAADALAPVAVAPTASVPAGVIRAGTSSGTITGASRGGSSLSTFGQPASRRAIYDPQRRALVVTAPKANAPAFFPRRGEAARNALQPQAAGAAGGGAPSTALTWNTQAALATFGSPDPFNVDLSGGGLTTAIPISVPAGPGGLTPPVQLTYSSASVSEQHNVQAPAGWVGSGWNLSLGAISWSERFNIDSCTTASCANGGNNWESVWQISDPFGTSAQLIPPDINYSTYWDDSPWFPCDIGTTTQTPTHACPVIWHTAPETHAKVVMYKSGITPPEAGQALAPCWRVYLPSGIMEEFGCTADSLAYFFGQNGADEVYAWNLDLITDLNGNQIHVGYHQDTATKTVSGVNHSYIRDTVLDHIEWDSPSCVNAQTACPTSGTAPNLWAPHARVTFQSSPRPVRGGYGPAAACNTDTTLRCDDPISLQGSGGLGIPDVYSTAVLNDIKVQVRATGSALPSDWASPSTPVLRDYQLSYWEWGPGTITDPVSGQSESIAGANLLTQVQQFDGQTSGALSLPARTFSYGNAQTQYYEDDLHAPASAAGCGPSWNAIANGGHCYLWSQSWWTNSYYLASANNGMGLYQVFTWNLARNDTHGLPAGASAGDPFYCDSHPNGDPCDEADDQNWSRTTLTVVDAEVDQIAQAGSGAQPVTTTMDSQTRYAYTLTTSLPAPQCANCTMGMYWGNINDSDYLDYYNATFMGFKTATVTHPDSSAEVHTYLTTEGYGLYDAINGTSGQVRCVAGTTNSCVSAPWWDLANAGHGHETLADYYDTGYTPGGTTRLLHETATAYQVVCATGSSGTPTWSGWGNWVGNHLVAGADLNDPVAVCEVQPTSTITHFYEGQSAILPYRETLFQAYDSFGRLTQSMDQASGGSPWQIVHKTWYVWDDAVSASATGASGEYVITRPAFTDIETVGGVRTSCASTAYAGVALAFGNVNIGRALPTTETTYTSGCGAGTTSNPIATTAPTGAISTSLTYDSYGHRTDTKDAEGTAGNVAHLGCGGGWSACTTYDTTYQTLPLSASNALNQTASTGYGAATDAHAGFGLWPTSATDANGQVSHATYDTLGRVVTQSAPGETAAFTTQWAYNTSACPPTGLVAAPCVEVDQTQRLSATATLTTRQFYDGLGRLIETRTPAPTTGQDLVAFAQYDTSGRVTWQSAPYSVPAYTGTGSAFAIPDTTQSHSSFTYDGLGRVLHATDPLGHLTAHSYTVGSAVFGVHGGNGDLVTTTVDALGHKTDVWTDPFGRTNIVRRYTGTSTYTLYAQTQAWYTYQGPAGSLIHADGTTQTTFSDDLAGRLTSASDPDSGTWHYVYDLDGNVTQQTDARGTSVYAAYDGLDRPLWQSANADGTSPLATDAYDDTTAGNVGIGRLTTEGYASGPNQAVTGTYAYAYDGRGRPTSTSLTIAGPGAPSATYSVATTYDDADRLATLSLPATGDLPAETLTSAYNDGTDGALASLSSSLTSPTSTLFQLPTYTGQGLLNGWKSGIASGNPAWQASVSLGYDGDLRVTDSKLTRTDTISGLSLPIAEVQPSYDAAGNVSSVTTTLAAVGSTPGGSEIQAFCYDDLDRLTWAGTQGTGPCGRAGSEGIAGAGYTASYAYDTFDRITSASVLNGAGVALANAAQGTYTYGASGHLHAVSSVGSGTTGYTAAYDAAGEMTCRAVGAATCTNATPTGQALGYDALRRLLSWQNASTSPTATGTYAYDGSGDRVWQLD